MKVIKILEVYPHIHTSIILIKLKIDYILFLGIVAGDGHVEECMDENKME